MSQPPLPPGPGATPVDGARLSRRGVRWLVVIAALVVGIVVLVLLSRCDGTSETARNTTAATTAPATAATDDSASSAAPASTVASATASAISTSPSPTSPSPTSPSPTSPSPTSPSPTSPSPISTTTPAAAGTGRDDLTVNGIELLPLSVAAGAGGDLSRNNGQPVTARSVLVQSVPADNGFWVGTSTTDRVWVQLLQAGQVSPHPVRPGDRVSFTGTMTANSAGFADAAEVDAAEGAAQLTAEKAHTETNKSSLSFTDG